MTLLPDLLRPRAAMRVLSLFSGIGGIDLGLQRAGMEIVGQCEIDPFCLAVLEKHWPNAWRHNDITTLTSELVREHCGRIDIIAGGFPCQDISNAGRRIGITGKRSGLWAEYHRIICELRPRYVLIENVAALLIRGMGRVLSDLAGSGYDAEWQVFPGGAFGTTHLRRRLFILAYPQGNPKSGTYFSEQRKSFSYLRQCKPRRGFGMDVPGCYWQTDQPELVEVDDGVSKWMDSVSGYGNAVIPQIPEMIGRWIVGAA